MRMMLAMAMLTLGASGFARGQEAVSRGAAENVREGNRLLDAGQYDEALSKYDAALKESPETPEIAYNRGIALYRLGKYADAEAAFQDALEPGRLELEAKTKYNLGRSAHAAAIEKKENLPEAINDLGRAIGFYNDALQIAPKDADGVKNKEAAERLRAYLEKILAQQQQQQQQEKEEPTSQPNEEPTSQPQDQPQSSQPSSQPSDEEQQQQQGEQDQEQEGEQDQQSDQQEGDQQQDDQQQGQQDQQQQGDQEQDQSGQQESGEQQEKENKMSEEQAERMLQEARDAERERREAQRAKMMRMRGRIPVEKDW